jgi:hypothetical protein
MASSSYSPEPVERSAKSERNDGCLYGLLLHPLVGLCAIFVLCFQLSLGWFGSKTQGRVEAKEVRSGKNGGKVYDISYAFNADGRDYEATTWVGEAYGNELPPEGQVEVTYLRWFPDYTSTLLPPGNRFSPRLPLCMMFTVIWNLLCIPIVKFLMEQRKQARKI